LNHYPSKPQDTLDINSLFDQRHIFASFSAIYAIVIPAVQLFKQNSQFIEKAKGKSVPPTTLVYSLQPIHLHFYKLSKIKTQILGIREKLQCL
jgi:hypothetical protein